MKESLLYKVSGDYLECRACNHYCRIAPFKTGICGVRENNKGKLMSLNYGRIVIENIDTIEKKPLCRFLPASKTLSIASVGCNFSCQWCQNDDFSQCAKGELSRDEIINKIGIETTPEQIILDATAKNCSSISYTYTEPTAFLEFAYETMKLARKANLKNIWVSNGFMSRETLDLILPYLDAINIDLKAFSDEIYAKFCGARLLPVLASCEKVFKAKVHLEITTLIIPEINDSPKQLNDIAQFIKSLSPDIPWHISRFLPAYKMTDKSPTSVDTLSKAKEIGKKAGLRYIYVENV